MKDERAEKLADKIEWVMQDRDGDGCEEKDGVRKSLDTIDRVLAVLDAERGGR